MWPVERIRDLGWVQNGNDARTHEAIFQYFPIISNLNLGMQKELGLWDGSEWERRTHSRSDFPIISAARVAPHWQNTLAVCAKNYCSMRKGGKTAPAWAKTLAVCAINYSSMCNVGKQPRHV